MTSIISPAGGVAQYSFSRPSAAATRAIVDSNPSSAHQSGTATPSDPRSPHGTLHRRKTNNYETALADRLKDTVAATTPAPAEDEPVASSSSSGSEPVIASGLAYRGDQASAQLGPAVSGSGPTGPVTEGEGRQLLGVLGRTQSFKQGDQKRMNMERMLSSDRVQKHGGYTTNQATAT